MTSSPKDTKREVIAVSATAFAQFGCPHCGSRVGHAVKADANGSLWLCAGGTCARTFIILRDGVSTSTIMIEGVFPVLSPHPRFGQPSHVS
ncbi:MAG TPA: hypothetical protein VJ579_01085 [Candidatus Paceibacterota bacterium]|nr:hypothetical protein [Candidatus Paceibacterota bacterium]